MFKKILKGTSGLEAVEVAHFASNLLIARSRLPKAIVSSKDIGNLLRRQTGQNKLRLESRQLVLQVIQAIEKKEAIPFRQLEENQVRKHLAAIYAAVSSLLQFERLGPKRLGKDHLTILRKKHRTGPPAIREEMFYSVAEASTLLGVHPETVRGYIRSAKLSAKKVPVRGLKQMWLLRGADIRSLRQSSGLDELP